MRSSPELSSSEEEEEEEDSSELSSCMAPETSSSSSEEDGGDEEEETEEEEEEETSEDLRERRRLLMEVEPFRGTGVRGVVRSFCFFRSMSGALVRRRRDLRCVGPSFSRRLRRGVFEDPFGLADRSRT